VTYDVVVRALHAIAVLTISFVAPACGDSATTGGGASSSEGGTPDIGPVCDDPSGSHSGEATYYDFADGSGNCSFPATPDDLMVGAMNHVDYAASAVCGACVALTGPSGSVTIRVVDQCPECPEGDIDLSPDAFSKIAALELGRVPITWDYVPCDVSGPIVYHFKEGSNPYWTAVQIRNHRTPIAKVEASDGAGGYFELPRADYNFFIADAGLGEGPYTFRVTDTAGESIVDEGIPFVDSGDAEGASQFSGCL